MRLILNIFAVLLIIAGIITVSYQGYQYTNQQEIAQLGDVKLVEQTQKTVEFPPYLGALCLVSGLIVLVIARKK